MLHEEKRAHNVRTSANRRHEKIPRSLLVMIKTAKTVNLVAPGVYLQNRTVPLLY